MLMKKFVLLLCVLMLALPAFGASAEGCFLMNIDALDMTRLNQDAYVQQYLSAQTQGLRVQKQIPEGQSLPVRLSLVQMPGQTLVFDKDYGYQSGLFSSGDIYLPYLGNQTVPYLVTLYVGNTVYAVPFMHLQSRLYGNGACTYGLHLYEYDAALGQDWYMGTMLDLNALRRQGYMAVDICASNCYLIGQADIFMEGDAITVAAAFLYEANVELTGVSVYVNTDCSGLASAAAGRRYELGDSIPVGDAQSALLYMPMTVNYDPSGLSVYSYNPGRGYLQQQMELWWNNVSGYTPEETEAPESAGEYTDWSGWNWTSEEPAYGEEIPEESPGESWTEWTWNAEEPASGEEIPEGNAGESWTEWNWEEPEEGSAEGVETMQMNGF